nr:hypothetical protein [Sphingomonas quercus]
MPALAALAIPASAQDGVGQRVEREATRPLRDTRLRDEKIPPILQLAASAPYSLRNMNSCAQIRAEIGKLNTALGQDVDTPAREQGEGARLAAAAAGEAMRAIIPGLGLVRIVTGADKQQKRVEAAVLAGAIRRGYLKGIGQTKGCPPPAAATRAARSAVPKLMPVKDDD